MAISLSDIRLTEREIRAVRDAVAAVRRELRKERPSKVRVSNLCDRISLSLANAERRTLKWKTKNEPSTSPKC